MLKPFPRSVNDDLYVEDKGFGLNPFEVGTPSASYVQAKLREDSRRTVWKFEALLGAFHLPKTAIKSRLELRNDVRKAGLRYTKEKLYGKTVYRVFVSSKEEAARYLELAVKWVVPLDLY